MDTKKIAGVLVMASILLSAVFAAELSVQLKRTNPGIAKEKSGELIFDVVNTDTSRKARGFMFCRSPDDAVVSSTLGASSGSGAQYVSPFFVLDTAPAGQQAMSITLQADSAGEKRSGCVLKYVFYKEITTTEGDVTKTTYDILKANGVTKQVKVLSDVEDEDYSQIRLDQSITFSEPAGGAIFLGLNQTQLILAGFVILGLAVFYVMGKSSRP